MRRAVLEQSSLTRQEQKLPSRRTSALAERRQQIRRRVWRRSFSDLCFMLPALILFTLIVVYPILSGLYYGFTDWDGINPHINFVGLNNFIRLLRDEVLWIAVGNTLLFAVATTLLQNLLGLVLALALNGHGRFFGPLRVLFLLPMILGGLVISLTFRYIFDPTIGLLNSLLSSVGLSGWTRLWLGDPHLVMGSIIAANAWQWTGFTMIIFLAGLQAIPTEMYEAASIDGARGWRLFRYITWPMLAPATTINILLAIIGSLKVFDIILVMTKGGPGHSSESIVSYLFSLAFNNSASLAGSYGYPAAISMMLSVAVLLVSLILLPLLRHREVKL